MALCRVELLGGLRAEQEGRVITRFQTHKTGALLAYLAFYPQRSHPRELLIDVLWPESEPVSARHKLSMALSSLRRQLEPPAVPIGAVIIANPSSIQLNPDGSRTDVADFEAALRAAARSQRRIERGHRLAGAAELYRGELLPGYFEEWIMPERERLAERYLQGLEELAALLQQEGDPCRALQYARRAVSADPLREQAHYQVMRLLAATGQPAGALRQYEELARLLAEAVGAEPAPEIRAFARQLAGEGRAKGISVHTAAGGGQRPELVLPPPSSAPISPPTVDYGLPAGTVTFLRVEFLMQALRRDGPEVVSAGTAAGHPLVRSVFRGHGGQEIRASGDGLVVAFGRASDALAAATAAQPALTETPARMALHTGEVAPGGDPQSSPALEHATRLLLAAQPGQILLSEKAAALAWDRLEPGFRLTDLGLYRLREGSPPERLFEVEHPQAPPRPFSRPNALPAHEGNLPLPVTRFFGRQVEIPRLCETLLQNRLITLTGPAGSGKTRLALEVAQRLREPFQGAVWLVPLADLDDPRLIAGKALDVLRLPRSPQLDPLSQLVSALSRQPALLLLDTFDHLASGGASLVQGLLERVPPLTCLVTSRERLDLSGEREFLVGPLPVPGHPSSLIPHPSSLIACPSVRLFVDRAQAVRPDFQVTERNALAIAELCRRLEGIPLALELAAAWAQVLTPAQMLAQLERRFEFLVSRKRDLPARHRSLRAAIDWTHRRLPPELQRFFARLSVFPGGWSLAAAQTVCETPAALEYLARLRAHSLVMADASGAEVRFRMLETLREYGAQQLRNLGEEAVFRTRHRDWRRALAEGGGAEAEGLRQREAEPENRQAARAASTAP